MQALSNKRIILGVTGGIAAYKAAQIIRCLQDRGAEVRVVMTPAAQQFITPLTLQALSGNPVHCDMLDPAAEAAMGHIEQARWADQVLIAPASADFIARLAGGQAGDLLSTLCLATTAPITVAPAMNQAMWRNRATMHNVALLEARDITILGPAEGLQACGDIGPGRMLEPEIIADHMAGVFASAIMSGLKITITAGPTREAIDPVRYISNHSSGKMGFALAQAARDAGAEVTLITGPVALASPPQVNTIAVDSAEEMYLATMETLADCDIFIGAAAVADYRPLNIAEQKIKKSAQTMQLELTRNPDIIAAVASHQQRPFTVGFAAETEDVEAYARGKLQNKKLDLIIANDVANTNIGFNSDNNAVSLIWEQGNKALAIASKLQLSRLILEEINLLYRAEPSNTPTKK
jgi:phosphopantothenoylcysteine decarboxylase/phosphopantothenate--cysteine ligase